MQAEVNLATAGRSRLHEGLAAGLDSADAASMLKALEFFGATVLILDVRVLDAWVSSDRSAQEDGKAAR